MFLVTVTYGTPTDVEAFENYYRDHHLVLAAKIPNLRSLTGGRCVSADGSRSTDYMVTTLAFDSEESAQQALSSEEGRAATLDIGNFATGGATVTYVPVQYTIP